MAKGQNGYFPRIASVVNSGPDGKAGTLDDISSMQPGETGLLDHETLVAVLSFEIIRREA